MTASTREARRVRDGARLVYSAQQVAEALRGMAERVACDLAGKHPVVLAVMHGGVFTAVNLCRHFDFPYQFDYVHATRYGDGLSGGDLVWRVRPSRELAGRCVLLIDDVLDRGLTLGCVRRELLDIGVDEARCAVLVDKRIQPPVPRPPVDYVALETEDVYLFGCGMDYKGHWRGLPALYAVGP